LKVLVPEGPLSLAGLSYGGWLACQYALRFPDRVKRLALISPAATVLPVSYALIFRALLTVMPVRGLRKKFYYWLLDDAVRSGETGKAFVDEVVADWEVAERCFRSMPLVAASVLENKVLRDFKVACLYLVGENEKIYPARKAVERLHRVAPWIKTGLIPKAGHDLWWVQARLVNEMLLSFLSAK
jgi:pimeloyl-ACP methyl ester carboxylesterase